jgi:hypothetical protein
MEAPPPAKFGFAVKPAESLPTPSGCVCCVVGPVPFA